MKKISISFNQAAGGKTDTGFSIFWMAFGGMTGLIPWIKSSSRRKSPS
jgi:hypothetical protein